MGGVNIDMDIDAELDALYFIPFRTSHVNVTNMTVDFVVEATSDDKVHWQLVETSQIEIQSVAIEMKDKFLNWAVKHSQQVITKVIQDLLPHVSSLIDSKVEAFNKMLAQEGPYSFAMPMFGSKYDLNLTMTTAPEVKEDSNLVKLFFDGLYMPPHSDEILSVTRPSAYPPRIAHSHSEQFWIHQSTLNSLYDLAAPSIFPLDVSTDAMQYTFDYLLPELKANFGNNVRVGVELTLSSKAEDPISIHRDAGLEVGRDSAVLGSLALKCSNETVSNMTVANFGMNLKSAFNFTLSNFVLYPKFHHIIVENSKLKNSVIDFGEHDYDHLFNRLLSDYTESFNGKFAKGWPLSNIDPNFGMIGGLIKNSTISPYVTDEWLYGGFSMQADLPTLSPELTFI